MIDQYLADQKERAKQGIPPLPLSPEQTRMLCELLINPPSDREDFLMDLLVNRISPGVDPSAEVKAAFLTEIATGGKKCSLISKTRAVELLGTMMGGYNLQALIDFLSSDELGETAAEALSKTILVGDLFEKVFELSQTNGNGKKVIQSWANGDWFTEKQDLAEKNSYIVYKVDGEINTDDFSPASEAWSRPDIPLHALCMGQSRFAEGVKTIAKFKAEGHQVLFAGDVVGTGSSRKSACNSLLWHIGEDIPFVPNKRKGGIILGGQIAPIFYNTAEDSGAMPIRCDVSRLKTGMIVTVKPMEGKIEDEAGKLLVNIKVSKTMAEEVKAGGRVPLIIGRNLTQQTRKALQLGSDDIFEPVPQYPTSEKGYTLAQKIVGQACGAEGILPDTACFPKMTTVGSQDTTGPMTRDEMMELACLSFQADFVMQSFCHTAAYPRLTDIKMHQSLPGFFSKRSGVALRPGDGVIHTWLNRFIMPDTVGTGGDSHTRFPIGISFPAGSGLVAFAATLGYMPLDMPESVLVRFKGELNSGITLRDVVNAIPYFAIQKGLLTVEKKNKVNIFNSRILEMEGLPDLTVEQAFELTDASAERSAAAGVIQLSEATVAKYLKSNAALLKQLIKDGYQDADTLKRRIDKIEEWLKTPILLKADKTAEYAEVIEIDLADIKEPILACPNDPDDVKLLSEVQGTNIDDVFIGSCMTNIGHFRATAEIFRSAPRSQSRLWICPPTRMDQTQLKSEGLYSIYAACGARTEIAGCSLCMGNQARVADKATVFSTSTRNFDNRMGNGAQVYLGSAELGALTAAKGQLPAPQEYFAMYSEKIQPKIDQIYNYLDFSEMPDYQ
ncbi:MAG: bifunctional aconitate hydratase 2/2-methylisocitrate dehydratase [Deltaproteobacteria bacterium]|jgi:aconitate hydratase 2 / 2-methylisocitrate dehydratase|nr:bifunctional aconitate hydratase 2/2-methylisocitrate dehydratase [Deltaproteobacteria bacterium]MBT4527204.1 bifunctional aconitate hydratase 2/2-methylisocitrate dehydratase [Deltaproteobacteria bacterium]